MNETWLTPSINTSEFLPADYTAYRKDRRAGKGGGVLIAVRNDLIAIEIEELNVDAEILWIKIQIFNRKPIYIGVFYRPPSSGTEPLQQLRASLEKIDFSKNPTIWLGGDFNIPDIDWDSMCRKSANACTYPRDISTSLLDIINDFSLHQMAKEVNHVHQTEVHHVSNILQLFLVSNPDIFVPLLTAPGLCDHSILLAEADVDHTPQRHTRHKVYLYHKADVTSMKQDIKNFQDPFIQNCEVNSIEDSWQSFENFIQNITDKYIPSKLSSSRYNLPWMNSQLKRLIRRKDRAFHTAKRTDRLANWKRYRSLRSDVRKALRKAEAQYMSNTIFESLRSNPKKFWSYIKTKRGNRCGIPALQKGQKGENLVTHPAGKAELLNKEYQSVFTKEGRGPIPGLRGANLPPITTLLINPDGVLKLLEGLSPHKAPGPDGILPFVLKQCAPELTPILTKLYNTSIQRGTLPSGWLRANITPMVLFSKMTSSA
ncbi:uncharacterized protein [Diadema setosum]|uniref:uncharacterized protein n=1 Tax=Diadema setosum TaxID=31175 RepID=UPI003B3AC2E0